MQSIWNSWQSCLCHNIAGILQSTVYLYVRYKTFILFITPSNHTQHLVTRKMIILKISIIVGPLVHEMSLDFYIYGALLRL